MPEGDHHAIDAADEPLGDETIIFEGRPALLPSVGALLLSVITVGLALVAYWLRRQSCHYRITTERVVVERGIFSKRMDQIDVYRINDYAVERPLGQRIMSTGNLLLDTMDRTTPKLRLVGLPTDVTALYEKLRAATEAQKRRRGVRVVDYE